VDPRIIDVVVRSLRKKIEVDPAAPAHVRTVQGVGYFFVHHSGVFWDTLTNRPLLPWPR
jgi:DNA-binding response OmpR family regulator